MKFTHRHEESTTQKATSVTEEMHHKIAERAYQIWEQHGRPEGEADLDWQEAEQEVLAGASGKMRRRDA